MTRISADPVHLERAACDIADRYRDGCYPELKDKAWKQVWAALVQELGAQCPGCNDAALARALNKGFGDSR
ncbi:MAG: hypothetical protein ABIJ09_09975 [Pseudomonadota bacterium]